LQYGTIGTMQLDRLHFSKEKTIVNFSACCEHNSAHRQPPVTEVSEQDRAQFTHKQKAAEFG